MHKLQLPSMGVFCLPLMEIEVTMTALLVSLVWSWWLSDPGFRRSWDRLSKGLGEITAGEGRVSGGAQ